MEGHEAKKACRHLHHKQEVSLGREMEEERAEHQEVTTTPFLEEPW